MPDLVLGVDDDHTRPAILFIEEEILDKDFEVLLDDLLLDIIDGAGLWQTDRAELAPGLFDENVDLDMLLQDGSRFLHLWFSFCGILYLVRHLCCGNLFLHFIQL